MSGKPQRDIVKRAIQIRTSSDMRRRLTLLLDNREYGPMSLSHLIEDVLFLVEHIYEQDSAENFFERVCQLKTNAIELCKHEGRIPAQSLYHITIDSAACNFADMLVQRYRPLLSSRSEVVSLLLLDVARHCFNTDITGYLARRLQDAERSHPKRAC